MSIHFIDTLRRAILLHEANPVDFANFRIADLPIQFIRERGTSQQPCKGHQGGDCEYAKNGSHIFITSLPYLSGYRGASAGMTWLALRVVETVEVGERA